MATQTVYRSAQEALDVRATFEHGWAAIKRFTLVLWVGGVMRACVTGGGGSGGGGDDDNHSSSDLRGYLPDENTVRHAQVTLQEGLRGLLPTALHPMLRGEIGVMDLAVVLFSVLVVGVVVVVGIAIRAWFMGGWLRLQREILESGTASFGTLFGGGAGFGHMWAWSMLQALTMTAVLGVGAGPFVAAILAFGDPSAAIYGACTVWALVVACFGIYLSLGLYFADHLVALDGASPAEAFWGSLELADGARVHMFFWVFIVGLASGLFMLAGFLACFVGAFVTLPLGRVFGDLGLTEGYLLMTRPPAETERWEIHRWRG